MAVPFHGQILAKGDDLPLDSSSCVVEPIQAPLARQSLKRMVAKVTKCLAEMAKRF